jgi:hypothetical protein
LLRGREVVCLFLEVHLRKTEILLPWGVLLTLKGLPQELFFLFALGGPTFFLVKTYFF